jgi:hypothetical protein
VSRAASSSAAQVALLTAPFGFVEAGVEFDENVAGPHALAVMHVNGADDPGLERLQDLAAAARHDLAGRGSDDVDRPEPGPDQGETEQRGDGVGGRAPGRRGRRLDDLERRRQEFALLRPDPVGRLAQRNDLAR